MLSTQEKKIKEKILIGDNNTINEYCNIHRPTSSKKKAVIGNVELYYEFNNY